MWTLALTRWVDRNRVDRGEQRRQREEKRVRVEVFGKVWLFDADALR